MGGVSAASESILALPSTTDPPAWTTAGTRAFWTGTPKSGISAVPSSCRPAEIFFSGGCEVDGVGGSAGLVRDGALRCSAPAHQTGRLRRIQQGGCNPELGDAAPEGEDAEVPRHYHSTALLLPTARCRPPQSQRSKPRRRRQRGSRSRTCKPWSFQSGRASLSITARPTSATSAVPLPRPADEASSIARVALLRCGSVTHGFNPDQRT